MTATLFPALPCLEWWGVGWGKMSQLLSPMAWISCFLGIRAANLPFFLELYPDFIWRAISHLSLANFSGVCRGTRISWFSYERNLPTPITFTLDKLVRIVSSLWLVNYREIGIFFPYGNSESHLTNWDSFSLTIISSVMAALILLKSWMIQNVDPDKFTLGKF